MGVAKQQSLLKTNKASGPDAIPPWFLKEHAAEIAPILTNIFHDSIESGTVPRPVDGNQQMYVASLKKGKSLIPLTKDLYL